MTKPLVQVIAEEFQGKYRRELDDFLGAASDAEHAAWVEATVEAALGKRVTGALFAEKSVGAVFGLGLEDGDRAVLKVFWPRFSHAQLSAVERCLARVVARGFPATRQRTQVFRTEPRGLWAAIYDYADGGLVDPHQPHVRVELARTLAALSAVLEDVAPDGLPPSPTTAPELWPPSHRSYIDNSSPSPEAAWIEARGRAAQAIVRDAGLPIRAAHLDWGVTNVRFRDDRVCAVLDWDSLHAASEADMVGRAAAHFTAQWALPVGLTPTRAEARAFVDEYEAARGRRFHTQERRVLSASADYACAQVARLQHAEGASSIDSYVELLREITDESLIE
jgi:hypothetical protein